MRSIERVYSVVAGRKGDRPPVSFWHHFPAAQREGDAAIQAHLDHLARFDLDFLKIMYDLGYPGDGPIRVVAQLRKLPALNGDEDVFGRHLATIRALSGELRDRAPIITTIFNPWATLRRMVRQEPYLPGVGGQLPEQDAPTRRIEELLAEDRAAVQTALAVIGESQANFAARCLDAGADGIFLSVRDDWVDTPANGSGTYDELLRPLDLRILRAASAGRLNVLHVCGRALNFHDFANYPVHAINWADRASGPEIKEVIATLKPAPCGGIDHHKTLPDGTPQQCAAELCDAVAQAGDRPILIAPGCTYDADRVPIVNLKAIRNAVETCL